MTTPRRIRKDVRYVYLIWTRYVEPLPPYTTKAPRLLGSEEAKPYRNQADARAMVDALNKTAQELGLNCEYFYTTNEVQ